MVDILRYNNINTFWYSFGDSSRKNTKHQIMKTWVFLLKEIKSNNKWDTGEPYEDMDNDGRKSYREPYTDLNNNNKYDSAEKIGNSKFNPRFKYLSIRANAIQKTAVP